MKEEMVTLGDVTEATVDKSGPSGSSFVYVDIGSIDRERKIISETNVVEEKTAPSRAKQVLQNGDVLVSMTRPNLNAVALVTPEFHGAIGSTGFHVLRSKWVEPKFLFYLVQTRKFIDEMYLCVQGALYPAVRPKDISSFAFLLPSSLAAQRQVVAKIEELFSELDKGIENLKTAQAQLKVYRQALLKHAFEGKLTAQWRLSAVKNAAQAGEQHRDQLPACRDARGAGRETAAALQQRIQQERAQRYQQQLADWEAGGKKGSKPKAPKPLPPLTAEELAELPDLPEGWGWCKLGDFIASIDAGKSFKCDEREPHADEIGVAKVSAVTWGEYDESESKTCTDSSKENDSFLIRSGDFLLSRANTIDLVGACVIARKVTKKIMLSDKTLRIVFEGFSQEYFLQYLRCRSGRNQIMQLSTGNQESMRNIGQDRIRSIAVPICSEKEAEAVIEALASRMSEVDQLELTLTTSLQQAEALRQSILKRAFSGQLVPQDPHDLPAPGPGKWFVYVLECEDGSLYKGHSQDVVERWKQHACGQGAEWTAKHPPKRLVHWEEFDTREAAIQREQELKTGYGREWLDREIRAGRTRQAGEPASVLLARIKAEKEAQSAMLRKTGKGKA